MKILLTGVTGQVGYELEHSLLGCGQIIALDRSGFDLANPDQVREVLRAVRPNLIVNAAAYTAVDNAEKEPALAMRINAEAPALMAEEARHLGAAIVHYSTDYVFDGSKRTPYTETDPTGPLSVYGKSKLAGEEVLRSAGIPHLILRTSWVYGMRGKNFLLTMLRLAREKDEMRIVADQHGAPTWSRTIAAVTASIIGQSLQARDAQQWWQEKSGLYHLTAQGQTTWYGFAKHIVDNAKLDKKPAVHAITTDEYPTPAQRPAYSVLSNRKLAETFGMETADWAYDADRCLARA